MFDQKAYNRQYYLDHREEIIAQSRAWAAANKDRRMARQATVIRARKYGLSPEDYVALQERANGHCECCGSAFVGTPHIEHDHATGKVRGLVCRRCNYVISSIEDEFRFDACVRWVSSSGVE